MLDLTDTLPDGPHAGLTVTQVIQKDAYYLLFRIATENALRFSPDALNALYAALDDEHRETLDALVEEWDDSRDLVKEARREVPPVSGILVVRDAAQCPDTGFSLVPERLRQTDTAPSILGRARVYLGRTPIGDLTWHDGHLGRTRYFSDARPYHYDTLPAAVWAMAAACDLHVCTES